jgi:hypothetical protein
VLGEVCVENIKDEDVLLAIPMSPARFAFGVWNNKNKEAERK